MVIHKSKSRELKGDQQWQMVFDFEYYWSKLNDSNYSNYPHVMNMGTYIFNSEDQSHVAIIYHFNPNKW